MVEVKASAALHVLELWLGVSKGMLPVKYFCSTKFLLVSVEFHGDHKTAYKDEGIWPPLVLGILPDFKQWCVSVSWLWVLSMTNPELVGEDTTEYSFCCNTLC